MEKLSIQNQILENHFVEKYKYPTWVYCFLMLLILIFISTVPSFLLNELDYHRQLGQQIREAEQYFLAHDYNKAIDLYAEIVTKKPHFKKGNIKLIQSYFALSSESELNYYLGLALLKNGEYKKSEISELSSFLPQKYHNHFNSLFKKYV